MSYTPSITDTQVFTALRAFLLDALGTGTEVVRGPVNRVPSPRDSFVVMSPLVHTRIATNQHTYTDTAASGNTPALSVRDTEQAIDYSIQLDFYGALSGDQAVVISTAFRDQIAYDFLETYGITPLYSDEPRKMPMITGENQYELRWILTAHIQYNPAIRSAQQFFDQAPAETLVNVDTTFPL